MRNPILLSVVALVFLTWTNLPQAGEKEDGRSIVDRAIKVMGGDKALAKYKACTWKETGTYYGMGEGLPYTGKYAQQFPGQFRMEIEGVFTMVLNGDQGWVKQGEDVKDMTKEEFALNRHNQQAGWIGSLVPLQDKAYTITALGESKVQDRPVLGVLVKRKDHPEVKLFFDKDSMLLVKSEYRTKAPEMEFKEVTTATYLSKYTDMDGAKVPAKIVMKRDDKLFVEAEIRDWKAAGKLDDKIFGKP
jgi:hypothetical protein